MTMRRAILTAGGSPTLAAVGSEYLVTTAYGGSR
jgi:hypothetical protein